MATQNTVDEYAGNETNALIRLSLFLRKFVEWFGKTGSWLIVPLVLITMWDVTSRKIVWIQIWLVENIGSIFESTLLQELEWHLHTGLFALVLGYGYVYNRHVRVDLVRERLTLRKQAWIEFLGCTFFMIPYCAIVAYFAVDFAYKSWEVNEISASQVGLTNRWIIKTVLVWGLILAALSGIAVWIQAVLVLFGPKHLRFQLMTLEWPDEIDEKRIEVDWENKEIPRGQAAHKDLPTGGAGGGGGGGG